MATQGGAEALDLQPTEVDVARSMQVGHAVFYAARIPV